MRRATGNTFYTLSNTAIKSRQKSEFSQPMAATRVTPAPGADATRDDVSSVHPRSRGNTSVPVPLRLSRPMVNRLAASSDAVQTRRPTNPHELRCKPGDGMPDVRILCVTTVLLLTVNRSRADD